MLRTDALIDRPARWDSQFGPEMTDADIDRLLSIEPFRQMDPRRFPESSSLRGILLNDTRLNRYQPGDIIFREGDYGSSAYLVLKGRARAALTSLDRNLLGRQPKKPKSLWHALCQLRPKYFYPEVRSRPSNANPKLGLRSDVSSARVFLQDVPGVLEENRTLELSEGMIFGELAALARTPRSSTVFAESSEVELLEIRWQGLRELMKRDDSLRAHIHQLYRENSLATHLRATPLFHGVPADQLESIVVATQFESHGNFEWAHSYKSVERKEIAERIAAEPLIVREGSYIDSLILICAGFARVTKTYGHGQRTVRYLGKGEVFGIDEIVYAATNESSIPFQYSLRAVGYVDVLRIPTHAVETSIIPILSQADVRRSCERIARLVEQSPRDTSASFMEQPDTTELDPDFAEFLRGHRFINGTQAMLIDLDRCTRCDDCVRACAQTHQNNPRFLREGPKFNNYLVAHACMHCVDPVCMIGCPTGAIGRDEETGNVLINDSTCIGCSTCANSCPYHNIQMVPIRDSHGEFLINVESSQVMAKATKCDLCVDQYGGPACQKSCAHDALVRIDMRDSDKLLAWLNR